MQNYKVNKNKFKIPILNIYLLLIYFNIKILCVSAYLVDVGGATAVEFAEDFLKPYYVLDTGAVNQMKWEDTLIHAAIALSQQDVVVTVFVKAVYAVLPNGFKHIQRMLNENDINSLYVLFICIWVLSF